MINEFITYLRCEINASQHTVAAYQTDLNQLVDFMHERIPDRDITPDDLTYSALRQWMLFRASQGDSNRTVRRKVQAVRALFKHLIRTGKATHNPADELELAKPKKRLPSYIRPETLNQFFDESAESADDTADFEQTRDRLIILMLYSTGIRRAELISLLDKDVDLQKRQLKVFGKRAKERIVPFGEELATEIERYRQSRAAATGTQRTEEFFVRASGEPLYPALVYRVVHNTLKPLGGADKFSPHVLRHSFASAMLNDGAAINNVKELLGHQSLAATQVYTHITISEIKSNYKLAHPRASKNER